MKEIRPQEGAQTKFLSSRADFAIYGGSAGSGKALNVNTPLLTPHGFKTIGVLQSGDKVFNEYFQPCTILEAYDIFVPDLCYRLTFSNGEKIECCSTHLWQVDLLDSYGQAIESFVHTTEDLMSVIHADLYAIRRYAHSPEYIKIVDYEIISHRPMRCIAVDNPTCLYLCGESLIPTHNSYALLLEAARHINNPGYGAVIFRREQKMIVSEGGLRDTAMELYPYLGGVYRSQPSPSFIFPSGAKITFAHLNQENEVLAWQGSQIPFIGFDELTHFCVDDQTEALTKDGWKLVKDICIGENVASLSKDNEIQYKLVTNTNSSDYHGDMVVYERGLNFKVTPNHRMIVHEFNKKEKGKGCYKSWKFVRADQLMCSFIPRTGTWLGKEVEYKYFEPITGRGHGTNSNSMVEFLPMDDWLMFLGWYLSEGCSFESNNRTNTAVVSIRQTKENGQKLLEAVLDVLPWRYSKTKDGQYLIFSRQLYDEVVGLGNTYTKRVPRFLFDLSPRQIELFLLAFAYGDGHFVKNGDPNGGIQFAQANSGLVDDLQELYFLCGRVSLKTYYKSGKFDSWRLSVSNKKRSYYQIRREHLNYENYTGKVYCITVSDNGTFLMRRNGRYCWTGNSEFQFNYMMSRMRSTCGVVPYCRSTTNPDSDSWVSSLLSWWIDQDTGYPIKKRSGVLRYFIRVNGQIMWADTKEELVARYDCDLNDPKSLTFVSAKITDNPILMRKDPAYLSNLKALSKVERARLLDGNWKIRPAAGMYFPREDAKILDWAPPPGEVVKWVRSWDLAASEESDGRDPDWTVGMLLGRKQDGKIVVADVVRVRRKAAEVRALVRTLALKDGREVWISIPQDPGQAGRDQADSYKELLSGFTVLSRTITRNKTAMAEPAAALWQQGNIELVRAGWNEEVLGELEQFPEGRHDDAIDALSAGTRALPGHSKPDYSKTGLSGRFKEVSHVRGHKTTGVKRL